MELTPKMQQVIDLGNQYATKVTYERDKVRIEFDVEATSSKWTPLTSSKRTPLTFAVGTISVEIGRKHCEVRVDETSADIQWFSSSLREYHIAIGNMLIVVSKLMELGYTSP
jgi:hypothetical protein